MNDQFHEEVVTQNRQGFQTVTLLLANVMMIVMAIHWICPALETAERPTLPTYWPTMTMSTML